MNNPIFTTTPFGADTSAIPAASHITAATSREIVKQSDRDAAFFRMLESQGIELNEPQIQAVRHTDGPLLTLAGAGSGKTTVLVSRAAYLISVRRVDPRNLLLVTFSKKAADEMKERLGRMPGLTQAAAAAVQVRTFHSLCWRIVQSQGYDMDIWSDERHRHIVVKRIMLELGLHDAYEPETLLAALSAYKMQMIDPADIPADTPEQKEAKQLFLRYEQWKTVNRKMDFDDLLLTAYRTLRDNDQLLLSLQRRFVYVSVDEFQDTNAIQAELVSMIVRNHRNIMAVGDDDQTIYSFNGASNEYILQFDRQYPQAKTVTLDINYRSAPGIIGLGNAIIRHNVRRKKKTLRATLSSDAVPQYLRPVNSDDEADRIIEDLLNRTAGGRSRLADIAILYRSVGSSRAIVEQLLVRGIPFVDYGNGQSFYEQWMVKPVVDHLNLALDHRSFSAIESILPTLYIGREPGMRHIMNKEAARAKKWPLIHLLELPGLKPFQLDKIKDRMRLIKSLAALKPQEAVALIRREFYDSFVEADKRGKLTPQKEVVREALAELESSAGRFDSLQAFLSFIREVSDKRHDMDERKQSHTEDRISLMTIHKSKGLEFPVVYLIGASEGIMPHRSSLQADSKREAKVWAGAGVNGSSDALLEEERRLAYVAVTRAKDELIVSSPAYVHGEKAEPSRFLLSAFGGAADAGRKPGGTKPASGTSPARFSSATAAAPGEQARRRHAETVTAWLCTGPGCQGWQRVGPGSSGSGSAKQCPLCGAPMTSGVKHIPEQ